MLKARRAATALEYRQFSPEENWELRRFFREAGYPIAILQHDQGWGAWSDDQLVGGIALCHESKTWIVRGPEVRLSYRRRGVAARLLHAALPAIRHHECYCVAYPSVLNMYRRAGFRACLPDERPAFLVKRVAHMEATGWDLVILRRPQG